MTMHVTRPKCLPIQLIIVGSRYNEKNIKQGQVNYFRAVGGSSSILPPNNIAVLNPVQKLLASKQL